MTIINEEVGAAAIVYKQENGQAHWLVFRSCDKDCWKFPKQMTTRAESSVRAAMRKIEKVSGLRSQVIEEVGRARVSVDAGKATRPALTIYYLLRKKKGQDLTLIKTEKGEVAWLPLQSARAKLGLKTEKDFLSEANRILRDLAFRPEN